MPLCFFYIYISLSDTFCLNNQIFQIKYTGDTCDTGDTSDTGDTGDTGDR